VGRGESKVFNFKPGYTIWLTILIKKLAKSISIQYEKTGLKLLNSL
jgi:hypothetical protein